MFPKAFAVAALLALTACGVSNAPYADDAAVAAAHYVHGGPPSVTLFTVVQTSNGSGAHTGLLINGSERVLFDPAGTWYHPDIPERNDLHYGISDRILAFYIDYHTRDAYNVIEQTMVVSPQVAEMVIARAKAHGAVAKAHCADSVSSILHGVPGFESLPTTWFPRKLSEAFGALPGATTKLITEATSDTSHGVEMIEPGKAPPEVLAEAAAHRNNP